MQSPFDPVNQTTRSTSGQPTNPPAVQPAKRAGASASNIHGKNWGDIDLADVNAYFARRFLLKRTVVWVGWGLALGVVSAALLVYFYLPR